MVVGPISELSTVCLYLRVGFGSKSISSIVPISREFESYILYCANNWGGKANSVGLYTIKRGARHVLVRSPHVSVSMVSEFVFVCPSTIRRTVGVIQGVKTEKNGTRMYSPLYGLPRETLLLNEEAERRLYGTMHALRSMGSGASRDGQRRDNRKRGGRETWRRHSNSIRCLARCQGHQMREDLCGEHIHVCALHRLRYT
jgi:hypothetical protein